MQNANANQELQEVSEGPGGHGSAGKGEGPRHTVELGAEDGEFLPGPKLGGGPRWRLRAGRGASAEEQDGDGTLFRCAAMLEQALSCSAFADVKFVFDDGNSRVSGHRGMLCGVSSEFAAMFASGMVEATTGEVRVRGVTRESFRGFLEFLYLGRAGKEMASADGREVWVLADLYEVKGVKEWLIQEGLKAGGVCAAMQYAIEGEGDSERLLEACKRFVHTEGICDVGKESLSDVSAQTAGGILQAFLANNNNNKKDIGEGGDGNNETTVTLTVTNDDDDDNGQGARAAVNAGRLIEGFQYVARWTNANGYVGCGHADVDMLLGLIDLGKIHSCDLLDIVKPSGLVDEESFNDLYGGSGARSGLAGRSLELVQSFFSEGDATGRFQSVYHVAVYTQGRDQRIAVTYENQSDRFCLQVYHMESKTCLISIEGARTCQRGSGAMCRPSGVAFTRRGELVVSHDQPGIVVLDRYGNKVREFGCSLGSGDGQLNSPEGVAVSKDGAIVVADNGNDRVCVFSAEGAFLRSFDGYRGDVDGCRRFSRPYDVAVGPDGQIVVADWGNARVQVFSSEGEYVTTISEQLAAPYSVGVSTAGEIVVSDDRLFVFSKDCVLLQAYGDKDVRGLDRLKPQGVCVDEGGRVFVCNHEGKDVVMLA